MVEIKTLIELFDECQIENVIAGLRLAPEKIIFVGFKEIMTKKRIRDLEAFLQMRNMNISLEYEIVSRYDFDDIVKKLNDIIERNNDCYFDLTGGKELVLTAMGYVSGARNIPMLQFNVRTGNLIRVKDCENIADTEKSVSRIKEIIRLNGGAVIYGDEEDFEWNLTEDFKRDIETIWRMCRINCGLWNRQSNVFANLEKFGRIDSGLCVKANLRHMRGAKCDVLLNKRIIESLIKEKLIFDYNLQDDVISFRYKNEQVHQCITKAGNILEVYAYMLANEIEDEEPGFYDDIDTGVFVDWDGVIHNEASAEIDTRNEIDVMMMRDLVPVFVSCKNGEVRKEALYELATIAQRFGDEYSKKVLLTTYISNDKESREYILRRAADMGIVVLEGVHEMQKSEFKSELKKRVR